MITIGAIYRVTDGPRILARWRGRVGQVVGLRHKFGTDWLLRAIDGSGDITAVHPSEVDPVCPSFMCRAGHGTSKAMARPACAGGWR